jgi:hypothetical protein
VSERDQPLPRGRPRIENSCCFSCLNGVERVYDIGVITQLARLVDEIEIPIDGDAIAEALALRDKLEAAIAQALGDFDEAKLWELDDAHSLTEWLRVRSRCAPVEAARNAKSARRCRRLPVTAGAWRDGTLSSSQVRAVVANIDDRTAPTFARDEAALVPLMRSLAVRDVVLLMEEWRERVKGELDDDADPPKPEPDPHREAFLSRTFQSVYALKGVLDPVGGHVLETALRLAGADELDGERTPARRRADALIEVAQFFLDHHDHPSGSRHRPHVNLLVDIDRLGDHGDVRFVDGTPVDRVSAASFLCESVVARAMAAGSTILDYGRSTRAVAPSLFNALLLRDRHCRFPDCTVPGSRCDAHHVVWWEHGGTTALDNLALQCRRHHRVLHKKGMHAKLLPDGTFEVTDPNGRTRSTRPPGPPGGSLF